MRPHRQRLRVSHTAVQVEQLERRVLLSSVNASHPGDLPITIDGMKFFYGNATTFSTSSSANGFSEASMTHAQHVTTLNGGTTVSTLNDAFDGALSFGVGAGVIDSSHTYHDLDGIVDLTGNTITADPADHSINSGTTFGGVTIASQFSFFSVPNTLATSDPQSPVVRAIWTITNNSADPITQSYGTSNNLGSDSNTTMFTSSDGNNTQDAADRWRVTFQNYSGTTSSDPRQLWVNQGPGSTAVATSTSYANGDDNPHENWTITVPAGETRRVMMFVGLFPSNADAAAAGATFDSVAAMNSAGLLAGLTQQQKSEIVNFNLGPTLTTAGNITYTENDPATAIDTSLTINDSVDATLASATVTLTNYVAGQDLLAFTNDGATMGNVAVSTNAAGVLTLTSAGSTATVAQWQAALRAVTYANSSDNPTTTTRSIDFVASNGVADSNALTSTVAITAVNDAPVLTVAGILNYTENDPATAIDSGLTLTDADNTTLASATVTINNFVAGQDVLSFTNDGATMGNIAISTNAAGVLTLTSAGSTATVTQWQSALRAVKYNNTSDNPTTTARSVDFVVNDGSANSTPLNSTINITAVNDAPVLANLETPFLPYAPGGAATAVTSTLTLTDADNANIAGATIKIAAGFQAGDLLTFADTPNITGVYAAGTLTLSGSDTVANYQAALRSITYSTSSLDPTARAVSFQATDGTTPADSVSRIVGGPVQLVGTVLNVYGSTGADTIVVSEGSNLIIRRNAVDFTYKPLQVTDIHVFGQDGNDTIYVNSLLVGTALVIDGGNNDDSIRVATSVTAAVTLVGGNGNDTLIGGGGNDTLNGGIGNDWLNGQDGDDTYAGGQGDDTYVFDNSTVNQIDTVTELVGEGIDTLNFSQLTARVDVDLTSDSALALTANRIIHTGAAGQAANFENVFGGSGNDTIRGNAANNQLVGNDGNDTLDGRGGNDVLNGGNGNDNIFGRDGNDFLFGGIGSDILNGGEGSDSLTGGVGDDGYAFDDAILGQVDKVVELTGEGTDVLNFSTMTTNINVNLNSDSATAGMAQRIVITGAAGQAANLENVLGGSGMDTLIGNAANNLMQGNGGNNVLSGGGGNDILFGGSGRSVLIGGTGQDHFIGGSGDDLLLTGHYNNEGVQLALQQLLLEWAQPTAYQGRIDHLLGNTPGGSNGSSILAHNTVTADATPNYLIGGTGRDWFLANSLQDVISDKAVDEVFTHIDTWAGV